MLVAKQFLALRSTGDDVCSGNKGSLNVAESSW